MSAFLLDADIKEIIDHIPLDVLEALGGKHVLITGGRGFLGRYFTSVFSELNRTRLAEREVWVTAIDNFVSAGEAGRDVESLSSDPFVTFVEHDVIKPMKANRYAPDFILHAAGIASPAHYRARPLEALEVATTGLKNSLELARANPGCKLLFFSSSEIYGDPTEGNVPTPETYRGNVACLGPRASYDESKRLGETLVQIYHQQYGVHGTIVRPFNVYGPGMQATDYRVLPNFAAKIVSGQPLQVYGDGNQTRTYCYVTDAIDGFLRVLVNGRAGKPYNIGNPSPEISVLGLVDKIQTVVGAPIRKEIMPHPDNYPADEPNRRCPDISKASWELGYAPRVSLEDGLDRFFGWAARAYAKSAAA